MENQATNQTKRKSKQSAKHTHTHQKNDITQIYTAAHTKSMWNALT